ncbi:hypothetical protein LMA04_00500 [Pseudescherichia vulneris]|uniref:hypothetical protein n=1 Tax=Pseudescherichia vulneris TaxID=566 RepID=UPI00227C6BC9|nr:hypothetical protein [Pseudescherichia vulneris]WAH52575.1 hypothetical protein LMA04_00500 [Pseudescherichia vulneris]
MSEISTGHHTAKYFIAATQGMSMGDLFWKDYAKEKPSIPAMFVVRMEDGSEFPAFWSIMWNQFKVGDVLLVGVTHWR